MSDLLSQVNQIGDPSPWGPECCNILLIVHSPLKMTEAVDGVLDLLFLTCSQPGLISYLRCWYNSCSRID